MTAPLASWAGCPCVGHSMHNLLRGPGEDFPFSPKLQICLFLLIRSDFASHSNQPRIALIYSLNLLCILENDKNLLLNKLFYTCFIKLV